MSKILALLINEKLLKSLFNKNFSELIIDVILCLSLLILGK
jgi:hypothetical protein